MIENDSILTDEERKMLRDARIIIDAWVVQGPRPDIHEKAQRKLKRQWPRLYYAIERLAGTA